jgi:DNA-binding NtrC family response regulator
VKQSGGSIEVNSALGHGTTFKLYFPRTTERLESVEMVPLNGKSPCGSETILLVEDEAQVRTFAAATLRPKGYTVLEAANGEEALDLIRRYDGPLHLLVSDVVMPGMSGNELAQGLNRVRPGIKVLLVSGYPDRAGTRQESREEGMHFLQKPYTAESLASKVREALDSDRVRTAKPRTKARVRR